MVKKVDSIGPLDQPDKIQKGRESGRVRVHPIGGYFLRWNHSCPIRESVQFLSALDSWPIRLVFVLKIEPAGPAPMLQSWMEHEAIVAALAASHLQIVGINRPIKRDTLESWRFLNSDPSNSTHRCRSLHPIIEKRDIPSVEVILPVSREIFDRRILVFEVIRNRKIEPITAAPITILR